jgi:hypothetical protein
MRRTHTVLALGAFLALSPLLPVLAAAPDLGLATLLQDKKKAPPKDDPAIPKALKDLDAIRKDKKGTRDAEGIGLINTMATRYPALNKKQKKAVVKGLEQVFRAKRSPAETRLLLSAGEALSRFEEAGAKALSKLCDDKRFGKKNWLTFRGKLVSFLGRPATTGKIKKQLIDYATRAPDDLIRAMAGGALRHYAKRDQKVRKEIVKKLVKELAGIYSFSLSNNDLGDAVRKTFEDTYATIEGPWMKTLTALTAQKIKGPNEWQRWFNKNKSKNWDKEGFTTRAVNAGAKKKS